MPYRRIPRPRWLREHDALELPRGVELNWADKDAITESIIPASQPWFPYVARGPTAIPPRLPANTLPVHGAGGVGPVGDGWHGIMISPTTGLIVRDSEVARKLATELMKAAARIDDEHARHQYHRDDR